MTIDSSIGHNIPLIAQPSQTTCWAAATAMLLGKTVQAIVAATPSDLLLPDGSLRNYSGRDDWLTGTRKYAVAHGLRYAAPQSWSAEGLHGLMQNGPVVFDMLWRAGQYARGVASPGHMICLTGISAEGGGAATLSYNDPWPPGVGAQVTTSYQDWAQNVPAMTYRVFYK